MMLTRNFHVMEFASKDGAKFPIEVLQNLKMLAVNLQVIRDHIQYPITINSGYRSPSHNSKIGGVKNSFHLYGLASDIKVGNMPPVSLAMKIEKLMDDGKIMKGGIGLYNTFVHYDIRGNKAKWKG